MTVTSPVPKPHHWLVRQFPSYKVAKGHKDRLIQEALAAAQAKLMSKAEKGDANETNSAIDHMLRRELLAAEKESRQPEYVHH